MIDFRTPTGINGQLNGTRSGYIQYASLANTAIEIHLPDFNNAFDLNAAIASQDYTGGSEHIFSVSTRGIQYVMQINS